MQHAVVVVNAGLHCRGIITLVCFYFCHLDGGKMAHVLRNSWHDMLRRVATICRP